MLKTTQLSNNLQRGVLRDQSKTEYTRQIIQILEILYL